MVALHIPAFPRSRSVVAQPVEGRRGDAAIHARIRQLAQHLERIAVVERQIRVLQVGLHGAHRLGGFSHPFSFISPYISLCWRTSEAQRAFTVSQVGSA